MRATGLWLAIVGTVTCLAATVPASAAQKVLYSLTEENDSIFTTQDRHYTQGLLFARTAVADPGSFWDRMGTGFSHLPGWLGAGPAVARHYTFPLFGQSMFTPTDITSPTPDSADRPYAGWLYIGAGLSQRDASGRTDDLQLLVGVVGPSALAMQVQNGFHEIFGFHKADGWGHQLRDEPALLVSYQTTWDQALPHLGPISTDLLPSVGVVAGNVLTYGALSFTLRLGQGLTAGAPARTIAPGLSGSGWFDPSLMNGPVAWWIYGGLQGRAVARNIFLQGNSWRTSASVPMRRLVADEDVGVAVLFRLGLRVDVSYIRRSKEFFGQENDDRIGSITVSAPF